MVCFPAASSAPALATRNSFSFVGIAAASFADASGEVGGFSHVKKGQNLVVLTADFYTLCLPQQWTPISSKPLLGIFTGFPLDMGKLSFENH